MVVSALLTKLLVSCIQLLCNLPVLTLCEIDSGETRAMSSHVSGRDGASSNDQSMRCRDDRICDHQSNLLKQIYLI